MKTSSSMSGGEEHTRLFLGGAEEAGMKGWRERAADICAKHGKIASKMKFASGPVWYYIARRLDKAVIFGVERLPRIGV